jgi:hypothetical protein
MGRDPPAASAHNPAAAASCTNGSREGPVAYGGVDPPQPLPGALHAVVL